VMRAESLLARPPPAVWHRCWRPRRLITIDATLHDDPARRAVGLQRRVVSRSIGGRGRQANIQELLRIPRTDEASWC
jgi:hypothetical protein